MKNWTWIALCLSLSGCAGSSVTQTLEPNVFYRRDLQMKINGVPYEGVAVVPKAPSYAIEAKSVANMDLVTVTTCHREWSAEDMGGSFKYAFTASPGLEDTGSCPVRIEALERKKGRHGWAYIDFQTSDAALGATLFCNGTTQSSPGVSVCQSREGLIQAIEFPVDVAVSPDSECSLGATSGRRFEFKISPTECVYAFREKAEPHRIHRLTTLGYQAIRLLEN